MDNAKDPDEYIKKNGVATTYQFNVSNPNWQYNEKNIISVSGIVVGAGCVGQSGATKSFRQQYGAAATE